MRNENPQAANELARFDKKDPTAAEFLDICQRCGVPLTLKHGRLIVPKGITSRMAELAAVHAVELVGLLGGPTNGKAPAQGLAVKATTPKPQQNRPNPRVPEQGRDPKADAE